MAILAILTCRKKTDEQSEGEGEEKEKKGGKEERKKEKKKKRKIRRFQEGLENHVLEGVVEEGWTLELIVLHFKVSFEILNLISLI